MKTPPTRWITMLATLFVAWCGHAVDNAWWQALDEAKQQGMRTILNGAPEGWEILTRTRVPAAIDLGEVQGQPVLNPVRGGTIVRRDAMPPEGYAVEARFRFVTDSLATYVRVNPAVKDPSSKDEVRPYLSASFRGGQSRVNLGYYYPVPDARDRYLRSGFYEFDGNGDRQLRWPEEFRRQIEHESSVLGKPGDAWLTLRGVVRPGYAAWYLNGLLVTEYRAAGLDIAGNLEIEVMPGAVLASAAVLPLPVPAGGFVTVPLDAAINAGPDLVARESLPEPGKTVELDGVPFVLAAPGQAGHDHVDVGESWFQEGPLEGHMSGRGTGVGGRWRGAFYRTPARLQLSVPTRRYRAIHLLAAADGAPDSVPVITAQFYRPQTGFPASFAVEVLELRATAAATALPVKLTDGQAASLHHVVIPVDPGELTSFQDLETMEIELTKAVRLWRAYPDPSYYSTHAAGLPSSVRVYAMTLEEAPVTMSVTPANYAHVFTAPEQPAYTVALTNGTAAPRPVTVTFATASHDGSETTSQTHEATLAPGAAGEWKLALKLARYGLHNVTVTLADGDRLWHEKFNLANLHADTRERGDWDMGKGPFFGYWAWRGGHYTPSAEQEALVMGLAGADGRTGTYEDASDAEKAVARRFKMTTLKHFSGSDHWVTSALATNLRKMSREEAVKIFTEGLEKIESKPSDITQLRYVSFFAEPHLGLATSGIMPEYWGGEPLEPDAATRDRVEMFAEALRVGGPIVRQRWPNAQIMMPHGDPMFCTYMLRWAPDIRPFVDGIATDIPCFERLPEMQLHQVALHRLYQSLGGVREMLGREKIPFPMYEGPCISDYVGAVPPDLAADLMARNCLILLGYGVDQFTGAFGAFHAGGYWGEQHYGGGLLQRKPLEYPKLMYAAYATMTRHLNRRNFARWLPTGSTSAYCMQFTHYRDGSPVYVLWQIRGTRPATLTVPAGTTVEVYDAMDNLTSLKEQNGQVTLTLSSSPLYLRGLAAEPAIALGAPEHGDAKPAAIAAVLGNFGDGSWRQAAEADPTYENNHPWHVKRTLGVFEVATAAAPADQGGKALAVRLGTQTVDRETQPYYTQLAPAAPIAIAGQPSAIGVWVHANSDWGRLVYSLRDAKGERWVSIGTREQWNCDDMHSWSYFCFDGWRYLRFEMPGTSPWDGFRNAGTTWWGSFGGDGIVDLPLSLERVIVERRRQVMYVNDPQPAKPDDVLLGGIHVEYETAADATAEAVTRSRIRRPAPQGIPELDNPIARLREAGELPPIAIEKIVLPEQLADGTRCYVHFPAVAGIDTYTVWAAPYADGRGALEVGKDWKAGGGQIRGLRAATDFWLFVVGTRMEGRKAITTKPAEGYKIHLEDLFSNK